MNKVVLMGRLTRNPDVRYSQGEKATCVARYTLAVNRRFRRDGEQDADFINCVAFGRQGEFAEKYLKQGTKIVISGRIQTGSYTNRDGVRFIQQMLLLKNRILQRVRQLHPATQVDISSREDMRMLQSHRLHLHQQAVQPQVRQ